MDEFDYFNNVRCKGQEKEEEKEEDTEFKEFTECEHLDFINSNGINVCISCRLEFYHHRDSDSDFDEQKQTYLCSGVNNDPTRCQIRRSTEKTIIKDVEGMG